MQLGSLPCISNSISSHFTHTVGTASETMEYCMGGTKDRVLSLRPQLRLVCPGLADYYFLDLVHELSHQNDGK